MLNKNLTALFLVLCASLSYANPNRKYRLYEDCIFSENYKAFTIGRTEREEDAIETELFGKPNFNSVMAISYSEGGILFSYHFYKVNDDNICLGIKTFDEIQENAVVYINTQKECGSKCKVYLSEPKDKQIFYIWEPSKEIIVDTSKEKIEIKTDKKKYTAFVRTGITELELIVDDFPKIKSIKGLEKLPYLTTVSLVGFDY